MAKITTQLTADELLSEARQLLKMQIEDDVDLSKNSMTLPLHETRMRKEALKARRKSIDAIVSKLDKRGITFDLELERARIKSERI